MVGLVGLLSPPPDISCPNNVDIFDGSCADISRETDSEWFGVIGAEWSRCSACPLLVTKLFNNCTKLPLNSVTRSTLVNTFLDNQAKRHQNVPASFGPVFIQYRTLKFYVIRENRTNTYVLKTTIAVDARLCMCASVCMSLSSFNYLKLCTEDFEIFFK